MSSDINLLMIGAMYENGGNTTHRFLDGHPEMFVYPMESQLGTKYVNDLLSSTFPSKYRWPAFQLNATPYEDYRAIIDEEVRVRARTPQVSKFRHVPFEMDDDERGRIYQEHIAHTGRGAGENVAAFFRATFEAWKDHRRSGRETWFVGYSPVIVIDADKILRDLPNARVLHIVRNPWSAFADTLKRPVPMSLENYTLAWCINQYYALLHQSLFPGRVFVLRIEDIMADPAGISPVLPHLGPWVPGYTRQSQLERPRACRGVSVGDHSNADGRSQPRLRARARHGPNRGNPGTNKAVPLRVRLRRIHGMKRVLVSGGSGFVGACLVRRLVTGPYDVHLLLRQSSQPWRLAGLAECLRTYTVDLRDRESVAAAVREIRPELVFHLAAYGCYPRQRDFEQMLAVNVIGTRNVLDACAECGFEAFVNAGSSSEYGYKDHPACETEAIHPESPYAISKSAATHYCRLRSVKSGLNLATLRLYSIYGPWEEPTRLVPALVLHGLENRLPPLVTPDVARDFVYVDDAVEALLRTAGVSHPPGSVYNVCSGSQTRVREVVEIARRLMGISLEPAWATMENRDWDTEVWVGSNEAIRGALGWRPCISFEQGFAKTLRWFQDNQELRSYYAARQGITIDS